MKKLSSIWMALLAILCVTACSDGLDNIEYSQDSGIYLSKPEVTATTASSLTLSVKASGDVNNIVKIGFCYSTNNQTPTIKDNVVDADENFTATISGLMNTTYYIRAYVYGNSRYNYSEMITAVPGGNGSGDPLADYVAPNYPDDYTGFADWNSRGKWNLANVHDPSVVLAEDGYYYMYQTDASYGNAHAAGGHFHGRRSKDLVNWEYLGGTMKDTPAWVVEQLNDYRKDMNLDPIASPNIGYWAPVVRKVRNGLYRMYYSIVIDNYIKTGKANTPENFDNSWTERAFIGLMETSDPASNNWVDKGMVVTSVTDKGTDGWGRTNRDTDWNAYFKYNAIDPAYVITPEGEHWLIYGSWHSGIAALKLNAETGLPAQEIGLPFGENGAAPETYGQLIMTREAGNRWQASEGPEIIYRDGYYYLFVAYDALAVPYNTRVARSKSITGPYLGIDGTDVTAGGEMYPVVTHPYKFNGSIGWVGISHCAVFDDGNDNWYYASQGRFPENVPSINVSNAVMMGHIRSIRWTTDGWPVVMPERYGAVPDVAIAEDELVGNWENIDLSYQYGVQKTSETISLTADHKVEGGAFDGQTWSYDAANQILKIGNVELCIQREADWEAEPRTHTIVYAGYNGKKTYWGKKSK
ncbi:arabinan endo-1,5-alpha-L-arabinosidase [uncultured Bacteroides sp.]|uniref:arabinan endo-1,5-alpha-L-arabinosidase n=1 Tax=uncultured Bacteroides sp. TaxID=162156 RepID=UPI00263012F9|nr:arabinan endo-1,5-alpha-L-arabinosidase [uncultured Bacteroides sp.]